MLMKLLFLLVLPLLGLLWLAANILLPVVCLAFPAPLDFRSGMEVPT